MEEEGGGEGEMHGNGNIFYLREKSNNKNKNVIVTEERRGLRAWVNFHFAFLYCFVW